MASTTAQLATSINVREVMIILGAAAIIVPLFYKIKISPILGYMLTGLLLGPSALGMLAKEYEFLAPFTIKNSNTIHTMSELGVMFLLFAIGLELSFERLKKMRKLVFTLGGLQMFSCSIGVALIVWFAFGVSPTASFIIGIALAMSSTAIVMQILADKKRLIAPEGRAAFGILLFQDIAIIPILFAVSFMSPTRSDDGILGLISALAISIIVVILIVIIGRLILRPIFKMAAEIEGPEVFMAASILVVIITGLATSKAGLSMTMGAFIAGLLLAETEYRREVEATIQPFKGLLLGVFLVSIGMSINLEKVFANPFLILGAVALLITVKALFIAGLGPLLGLKPRAALYAGLMLGGAGEFAFVIIGLAKELYVVGPRSADFALTIAAISMALTPILAEILEKGAQRRTLVKDDLDLVAQETSEEDNHVIVAGFGRVGEVVTNLLAHHKVQYIAADTDIARVGEARINKYRVYYGDISRPEFLDACGIARAKAIVITMHGSGQVNAVVKAARKARPDIPIVVRAKDGIHAQNLYALGVNEAVPETLEASLQLAEAIMVEAGVPMGNIIVSVHEKRAQMREEILESSSALTPSERLRSLKESHKT